LRCKISQDLELTKTERVRSEQQGSCPPGRCAQIAGELSASTKFDSNTTKKRYGATNKRRVNH
jgi:hypothetical protein